MTTGGYSWCQPGEAAHVRTWLNSGLGHMTLDLLILVLEPVE